jgi:hypothetical protein
MRSTELPLTLRECFEALEEIDVLRYKLHVLHDYDPDCYRCLLSHTHRVTGQGW